MDDRASLDALPVAVWIAAADGRLVHVNAAMAALVGRAAVQLVGQPVWHVAAPDHQGDIRAFFDETIGQGRTPRSADLPWLHPDGSTQWALTTAVVAADGRVHGTAIDVTARRTREALLAQREAYYRVLGDMAADQIFVISADDRVEYVNRSAAEQFRTVPERLIGRLRTEVFPPEIATQQARSLEHVFRTGQPFYVESAARYLDRPVWIGTWLAPVRDARGQVTGVLGYSRDMTHRKRVEEALRAADDRLRAVLAHVPIVLWSVDADGVGTFCGGRALETLGLREEEVVGRPLAALEGGPLGGLAAAVARALVGETSNQQLAHGTAHFDVWSAPIAGDDQTEVGAVTVLLDISERRRLEDDLASAMRLEAIGRLAGGVAHDFNNNLTAILGYVDMLLEQIGPDKPIAGDLGEIRRAADRSAALVRQLLAFGRRQVVQPAPIDVNAIVGDLRPMLERLLGPIALVIEGAPNLHAVVGDAGQFEQVLLNLALNARDAMPEGGTFAITTANDAPGWIRVTIRDTGSGMDAGTRARVFEPFFTTKPFGQGTGLGLSTVHGIVRQWGGTIEVESDPGAGTQFHVRLPASEQPAAPRPGTPPRAVLELGRQTVLIVEDEEMVRRFAVRALTRHGLRVVEADSPQAALATIEKAADGDVALLITDVVMPGMSGVELAARVRQLRPTLPVLYMSGYPANMLVPDGRVDPGVRLLAKPFTTAELLARVQDALGKNGT